MRRKSFHSAPHSEMSLDTVHQREFGVGRKLVFVVVDLPGKFYPEEEL